MKIVIEGARCTGKTSLTKMFENQGFKTFHFDKKTDNSKQGHLNIIESTHELIMDRFAISECYVYSKIFNRVPTMSYKDCSDLINKVNYVFILVDDANAQTIIKRAIERGREIHDKKETVIANDLFRKAGDILQRKHNNIYVININHFENRLQLFHYIKKRLIIF